MQGNGIVYSEFFSKVVFPWARHGVPPVAQRFPFVYRGGIDTGDLEVVVFLVEVDLHVTDLHIVDGVVGDSHAVEFSVHGDFEIGLAGFLAEVGYALYVESKCRILEEKVDVFKIGLDVLAEVGVALGVEVVFDLHFIILEDLGIGL